MTLAFIRKLAAASEQHLPLSRDDKAMLEGLCDDVRPFHARRDIISEGDNPRSVILMLEGWAHRYKILKDGSRQITAFLIPGDFCDTHITLFDHMDHSIGTLTDCRVALIPKEKISELMRNARMAAALWWGSLIDEAVLRAWIVNLGRRDSFDRVGHLILELHARMALVGLANPEGAFDLPMTQEEMGDALGLTPVHVNRMLRLLREEGLAEMRAKRIVSIDIPRLRKRVGFDENYLHLPRSGDQPAPSGP